jgi:hypothetical protein
MVYGWIAAVMLVAGTALGAAAEESPSRTPPEAQLGDLTALTPLELARAYLAAAATLPLAQSAGEGLGILNVTIDGKEYRVDAANAAQFISLFEARAEAYGKAIAGHAPAAIEGSYAVTAGAGCRGEKFDPRSLFAGAIAPDGSPLMATTARIIQNGIDTNLLVTQSRGRERLAELISGTTVGNTVVFTKAMGSGFSVYGTVRDNAIELKLDPEEVKTALGAEAGSDADWQALSGCAFVLTRR